MTVLIAHLPSPEGNAALELGMAEARLRGTKALVVTSPRSGGREPWNHLTKAQRTRIDELGAAHGVEIDLRTPEHGPDHHLTDVLNEIADAEHAQVLVIGMRQRSPLGKFVLGSMAEHILMKSHVPVLTVTAEYDGPEYDGPES
ncbi:universal stress protein [Brevibacterium litoralis]|uniref:universal stress protein n=1 Tax=Brevibacterium litoralis TaxID=3138935 RepID=UPI0032F027CC